MGQEKTQRENGKELRDGQQGRCGRRMGLRVILCSPLPVRHGGQESEPPTSADVAGPVLSLSLMFWGLVHSCLGLTIQSPSSRSSLPWTKVPSAAGSDGEVNPGSPTQVPKASRTQSY